MQIFHRISEWLGLERTESRDRELRSGQIEAVMERARKLHYSADYEAALVELTHARSLLQSEEMNAILLMIDLSRAGVLARQGKLQEGRDILDDLKSRLNPDEQKGLLSYVWISLGVLAQEAGLWQEAEGAYNTALTLARAVQFDAAEGRAKAHLADVALHDGSANYAIYLLQEALPRLSASGDVELNSYFFGRLGEAMLEGGQVEEGKQMLGRAMRLAEHLGYKTYERMWRESLALHAIREGNIVDAKRHLMAALTLHLAHDAHHVRLLVYLTKICVRLSELKIGDDYARQAVQLADVLEDPIVKIRATAARAIVLRTMGQNEEARALLEDVIEPYRQLDLTVGDHSYVDVLRNLAAAQTVMQDYDVALATYEKALAAASHAEDPADVAGTYRDIGILYMRRQDLEEAIRYWAEALKIYEDIGQRARVARLYCDIANLRKQLGQIRRAQEDYSQALMLLSSVEDDETRGIVLSNAAAAYVDQGDIETAESFFIESIKLAQKLNDQQAEATRRGNYGWFLLSTGRPDRAMASLSYALRQSESLNMLLQSAVQTDNMGLAQAELGHFSEALRHHQRAHELIAKADDPVWMSVVQSNMAHAMISLGQLDAAGEMLKSALAIAEGESHHEVIARARFGIARIHMRSMNFEAALSEINRAIKHADQIHSRRLSADALSLRSQIMHVLDRREEAQTDWARARQLYELLHLPLTNRMPAWLVDTSSEHQS